MPFNEQSKTIKYYRRLKTWDYSRGASLFITISTQSRRALFGHVADGAMHLSPMGRIVEAALVSIPRYNPGIVLFGHVVMPDHVHFNVHIQAGLAKPLFVLGNAIRRFKNHVTKAYKAHLQLDASASMDASCRCDCASQARASSLGQARASSLGQARAFSPGQSCVFSLGEARTFSQGEARASSLGQARASSPGQSCAFSLGQARAFSPCATSEEARAALVQSRHHLQTIEKRKLNNVGSVWQQGYHDHLCLSRNFIDSTERYIAYNVAKWELMHNMPGALQVHEPLDSPRLDAGEYWKGVGNIELLDPQRKLLSLRVTRRLASPAAIARVVARMEKAVANGYVITSGFISPGEKAVRDMLCANKAASFIRMLPSRISNTRPYKPESRYVAAFAEGRYLEIARGNEEVEFSRSACLDLNAEIVRIAKAGEGLSVYWQAQGPSRL